MKVKGKGSNPTSHPGPTTCPLRPQPQCGRSGHVAHLHTYIDLIFLFVRSIVVFRSVRMGVLAVGGWVFACATAFHPETPLSYTAPYPPDNPYPPGCNHKVRARSPLSARLPVLTAFGIGIGS